MAPIMKQLIPFQLLFVTLGFFLPTYDAVQSIEVRALNTFKEAIFEDPFLVLSNWNSLDSDPCNWFGVTCSGNEVTKLNISGSSIKGFIAEELFQLSSLQELILRENRLIGAIPTSIGSLKSLRVLDLGENQLSGPIPTEIRNLVSIVQINLQSNGLTGKLPLGLNHLENLQELRLDRNKLHGTITGYCNSSSLKVADFSFNFLIGNIPKCLEHLPRNSFRGNCLESKDTQQRKRHQCGGTPLHPQKAQFAGKSGLQPTKEDNNRNRDSKPPVWLIVVEVMIGVTITALFLIALLTLIVRCKTKPSILNPWKKFTNDNHHTSVYVDSDILKGVMKYNREELEIACEDFSNIIGSSSDSLVYKGIIKGGPEIAVISLCVKEHWTGYIELYYQKEVADLARLNHENTGKLLGYCMDNDPFTRMLVFEYASNGTLFDHLHLADEEGCNLSWTRRMKIIVGIAKGLKYLHTEIDPPFTISELNSSAIYLTEDFSPKLVDFESWKTIVTRSENNSRSISHEGDICVLPSSFEERHLDIQGNIYAFGVLLLEIVSGRPSFCKYQGCLVDWAKEYIGNQEEMGSIVDPALKYFNLEDLEVICKVVSLCIHLRPRDQISMKDLCVMLDNIDTSPTSEMKATSLAWAELMLSP